MTFQFGTKAETLAVLRERVNASLFCDQVVVEVGAWVRGDQSFISEAIEKFGSSQLAVRSSAIGEDSWGSSLAGAYTSLTGVRAEAEELIAAAHAGCFAMQLSAFLTENGTPPDSLEAKAVVTMVPGTGITGSAITLKGQVPGIDADKFMELAEKAKSNCPVSKALGAIDITLDASLA